MAVALYSAAEALLIMALLQLVDSGVHRKHTSKAAKRLRAVRGSGTECSRAP